MRHSLMEVDNYVKFQNVYQPGKVFLLRLTPYIVNSIPWLDYSYSMIYYIQWYFALEFSIMLSDLQNMFYVLET